MNEYDKILAIVSSLGFKVLEDFTILDFGCGDASGVFYLRDRGFKNVFGCDFEVSQTDNHCLFSIRNPYQLPFADNTFDFVYSSQVFEHIKNYPQALSEIYRVLKPNGFSLHIFPPKWRWIEPHVFVPLAGVIQKYWWLLLWAKLGIRNQFQDNKSSQEVAQLNYDYLDQYTNYLSRSEIYNLVNQFFSDVRFCELIRVKYSQYPFAYNILKYFPFIQGYLGTFNMSVIFFRKS